ncbi:hypothetical protein PIB30_030128 [Stylosanthes scabra]|uniref:Replication factor A C-terminal domain-containing protein n=1 Tax=Stylosanthes scabra TaxID=79078 RepID=A0ABU6YAA9_9FABA|nr:hypothetical protein [Stylosanthes scabra]
MAKGDKASQGIAEIPTQSQFSVGSELAGGSVTIETIESVLNMTQEAECWVLGELVSIQAGAKDWCYASCTNCFKKVETKSDRYKCDDCGKLGSKPPLKYRLIVIITYGTGCINVLFWNSEAVMLVGKSAREVMNSITSS